MLSLTKKNIEDYLIRLGLEDFDTTNTTIDESGNLIVSFDPDLEFKGVRKKLLNNPLVVKKINSQGILSVELYDTIWVEGNEVHIATLFEVGTGKIGTRVKMIVKYVKALVNGQMKQFLGFEAYNNYYEMLQN